MSKLRKFIKYFLREKPTEGAGMLTFLDCGVILSTRFLYIIRIIRINFFLSYLYSFSLILSAKFNFSIPSHIKFLNPEKDLAI